MNSNKMTKGIHDIISSIIKSMYEGCSVGYIIKTGVYYTALFVDMITS